MKNTQRLDKTLANLGYGSRKEIKLMIKNGLITVDGVRVKDGGMQVAPDKQDICVKGKKITYRRLVYLMLNKPAGVISATEDKKMGTVIDLIPKEYHSFNVFPVGRLDKDTEGLLLITNDGQLAHNLLSPRKHVSKKYYAIIEGIVTEDDVKKFSQGIILEDGYAALPAELTILKSNDISEIELVIYEGKFHQVKRMFGAIGKKVSYLKRIAMGKLTLDLELEKGKCRELTNDELASLIRD